MNDENKKEGNELIARVKEIQERRANHGLQLPLWPDDKRGTPNTFLRSALFAAIQGKDRVWLKNEVLASQRGITIIFTGEQLNQEDLTVWESVIHLVREQPLGTAYTLSAHSILKNAGMHTGNSQHKQLYDHLRRLTAGLVEITQENTVQYMGHLINSVLKETASSHYEIEVNKKLIQLYGEKRWTPLDVELRQKLRNRPLALALFRHYSTHHDPYPYKLETIAAYVGSKNQSVRGFKQQLTKALTQLVHAGFLCDFAISKDNLVTVKRHGIRDI